MTFRIGLFLANQFPAGSDMRDRFEDMRQQVIAARDADFASIWVGQHFLTRPIQSFQPVPLIARLLPDTGAMVVGTNILVLPFLNPVSVAEESATLDVLSEGRFVLGVGLGYRDEEFEAFGVRKQDRVGRLTESISLLRAFFAGGDVEFSGKHFVISGLGLGMRPRREGGPPIWIAASVDAAIERAAQLGDGWPITFYPSYNLLTSQMTTYREARAAANLPFPVDVPILRECFVGPTAEAAFADCGEAIEGKYATYRAWGQDSFLPADEKFDQPLSAFHRDRFLIGDPDYVASEINRYQEGLGVNHFILRMQWPGLEQEKVLSSIELFASHVMPQLGAAIKSSSPA